MVRPQQYGAVGGQIPEFVGLTRAGLHREDAGVLRKREAVRKRVICC